MGRETKQELLIIGGVVLVFTALGFLMGLSAGSKKKKQLIVTPKGELKEQEVE